MKDKTLIGDRTHISDENKKRLRDIMLKINTSSIYTSTPKKTLERIILMLHVLFFPEKYDEVVRKKWNNFFLKMYIPYKQ